MKASACFSESDRKAVAEAVRAAEQTTAGEIVPVVAASSGRYDRAEDLFGLVLGLLALTLAWLFCPAVHPDPVWAGEGLLQSASGLIPALLCVAGGFVVGAVLASRFPVLCLPFVPSAEQETEVLRAARAAFAEHRVRRTDAGTGILIYVSLLERRVVILPDHGIAAVANSEDWNRVRDALIEELKANRPAAGLIRAIQAAGRILAEHCPRQPDDVDELGNDLILMD